MIYTCKVPFAYAIKSLTLSQAHNEPAEGFITDAMSTGIVHILEIINSYSCKLAFP